MQIYYGLEPIEDDGRPVFAAMGNFDGVHRGHQALFRRLQADARRAGARTLAITFDPHPLQVLRPEKAPPLLTNIAERAYLLSRLGINMLQVMPFDRQFAATGAEEFLREILVERFRVGQLYAGAYFAFGRGRQGNKELIRRLEPQTGCGVTVIEPLPWRQGAISSTAIRRLVAQGEVEEAHRLLTEPFVVAAQVQRGAGRGGELGIPTANLALPPKKVQPAGGVYAVQVCVGGQLVFGVANIGTRPTFTEAGSPLWLEVHLLDWHADIYGEEIRVGFLKHLRPERRFPSVQAFLEQIEQDIAAAKKFFSRQPAGRSDYLCLTS